MFFPDSIPPVAFVWAQGRFPGPRRAIGLFSARGLAGEMKAGPRSPARISWFAPFTRSLAHRMKCTCRRRSLRGEDGWLAQARIFFALASEYRTFVYS